MQILTLPLGELSTNCYIVYNEDNIHAIVIDPADDAETIRMALRKNGLHLGAVLLTHGHFDHMMALDTLLECENENAEFYLPAPDTPLLADPMLNGSSFFLGEDAIVKHPPTRLLQDGEEFSPSGTGLTVRVLFTPGHTPGSAVYRIGDALFTGDHLFRLMVGRTDLPGGSSGEAMKHSLAKIKEIEGEYRIFPGHGPSSTLSYEKRCNIYLR